MTGVVKCSRLFNNFINIQMPHKVSKKTLIKKLDTAWSRAVKERAGNKCEVCGKRESLNSHHYVSRSNRRLRWEVANGICVCAGCHLFKKDSFHKNPIFGHFWMEDKRWEDFQWLTCHQNEIAKWTLADMEEKLKELES